MPQHKTASAQKGENSNLVTDTPELHNKTWVKSRLGDHLCVGKGSMLFFHNFGTQGRSTGKKSEKNKVPTYACTIPQEKATKSHCIAEVKSITAGCLRYSIAYGRDFLLNTVH